MRGSTRLLLALTASAAAGCNGSDGDEIPGNRGTEPSPAAVLGLMMRMDAPWQGILIAERDRDLSRLRERAAELAGMARERAFHAGRDEEVWRQYADLLEESVAGLQAAADWPQVVAARQELERSCNECHRRYQ